MVCAELRLGALESRAAEARLGLGQVSLRQEQLRAVVHRRDLHGYRQL
jgi:hypothetical protein